VAPVTLFQSQNYKLCVSLGLNPRVVTPVRDVLDTGAGPNLVREDVLPRNWERALITGQLLPRVHNASGRRMPVKGVVSLVTQVGELVRRVRFFVVPCLSVPFILGCHFINIHVLGIFPREKRVELRDSGAVSLLGKFEACRPVAAAFTAQTPSNIVRIARPTTVPARSEAHVWVVSSLAGLCLLNGDKRVRASPVMMASGVAEVHTEVPFLVRVINPSQRDSVLRKGMVVRQAALQPEQIMYMGNGPEGMMEPEESRNPEDLPKEKIPWEERLG
jgi:hypothetical protein